MATSVKVLQKSAFAMEKAANGDQSTGWGESGSEVTLGSGSQFTHNSFPTNKEVNHDQDNSIIGDGFQDTSHLVTEHVETSFNECLKQQSQDNRHYWRFGFCLPPVTVVCFVLDPPLVGPSAGDVYADTDLNEFTFLRRESGKAGTYYIFRADDDTAPTLTTGDLDVVSGSGDDPLVFTARSTLMYEKTYELDSKNRHYVDFETFEQITGYTSGDKKNRMATIAKEMGTNDFRYKNAMCKGFSFLSDAGSRVKINSEFVAHDEERGDYSSSSWTLPSRALSEYDFLHHQAKMEIGTAEGSLSELGVSSFSLGVEIPLVIDQDTLSGTNIKEPIMEGKYGLSSQVTISRHYVDTWLAYRDAWTDLIFRTLWQSSDYYMAELLVNSCKIPKAGPNEDNVAKEPLDLTIQYDSTNNWSSWLYGNTLVHKSPVILRVRNKSAANQMFAQ